MGAKRARGDKSKVLVSLKEDLMIEVWRVSPPGPKLDYYANSIADFFQV